MQKGSLMKVEWYRFSHSYLILLLIPAALAFSLFGIPGQTASMQYSLTCMFLFPGIAGIGIGRYVGREFQCKTIRHELMKGFRLEESALVKTVTCGLVIPTVCLVFFLIFLRTVPEFAERNFWVNLGLIWILLIRICSCTVLYVMLCRDSLAGGFLAFVRYSMLELGVATVLVIARLGDKGRAIAGWFLASFQLVGIFEGNLQTARTTTELYVYILSGAAAEYLALWTVLCVFGKRKDF